VRLRAVKRRQDRPSASSSPTLPAARAETARVCRRSSGICGGARAPSEHIGAEPSPPCSRRCARECARSAAAPRCSRSPSALRVRCEDCHTEKLVATHAQKPVLETSHRVVDAGRNRMLGRLALLLSSLAQASVISVFGTDLTADAEAKAHDPTVFEIRHLVGRRGERLRPGGTPRSRSSCIADGFTISATGAVRRIRTPRSSITRARGRSRRR
jgi:hypothetical protein